MVLLSPGDQPGSGAVSGKPEQCQHKNRSAAGGVHCISEVRDGTCQGSEGLHCVDIRPAFLSWLEGTGPSPVIIVFGAK